MRRKLTCPERIKCWPTSFAEATKAAIADAAKTMRHMNWFEVVREGGRIVNGKVEEFPVELKIGFKLERLDAPHRSCHNSHTCAARDRILHAMPLAAPRRHSRRTKRPAASLTFCH
jgi:flavin-binding protein dodecin